MIPALRTMGVVWGQRLGGISGVARRAFSVRGRSNGQWELKCARLLGFRVAKISPKPCEKKRTPKPEKTKKKIPTRR